MGIFSSTPDDDDAEQEVLDDLRSNPSSINNNSDRQMQHGRDYGGNYRPDREWPPRGSSDRRDSE